MEKMGSQHSERKVLRLPNWDYKWPGRYFITICTHRKVKCFGKIRNKRMELSNIGIIADVLWHQIPCHSPVELDAFVVMPNHIHGILVIQETPQEDRISEITSDEPLTPNNRFRNIGKNSVSSIIGSYKSSVSRHAHRLGFSFQWQRGFYEHIIRNDEGFWKISDYINNNPQKWDEDKFYRSL